jgi:hypothetical protein
MNWHGGSVSGAFTPTDIDVNDPQSRQVISNMALDAVEEWREWQEPKLEWVRWLTKSQANARWPGFIHHGDMDPATRSDAWSRHPQRAELDALFLGYVRQHMGASTPTEVRDAMRTDIIMRESDRCYFQAIVREDGRFDYRFSTPDKPFIWDNAWVSIRGNGGPIIPFPFDHVKCFVWDERFHIECRSTLKGKEQAGIVAQQGHGLPFKIEPSLWPSKA